MNKSEVVAILNEISDLLELAGENPFKARSYVNVARAIEQCEDDLEVLVREKRLRELKGVGEALEEKLTELVNTGRLEYYETLREQFPATLFELFRLPGLGAKRIKMLYDQLGVKSLSELEAAVNEGRLAGLRGFGPKIEENIRDGLASARQHQDLHLLHIALREATELLQWLRTHPAVIRSEIAGSLRRRREVIKDVDLVVATGEPSAVMAHFVQAPGVAKVTGQGDTKASVVLRSGMNADLRVVTDIQFPYALCHFTGSKDHNVVMRQRAKDRGLKLNEYGLFRGEELVACADEATVYAALDLPLIPPELREDLGEFDCAATPSLLAQEQLKGLIHCHSAYSDGRNTIEQMARAAKERGYKYLVLTDHSQSAAYAGGLLPESVYRQHEEIQELNKRLSGIRIIRGIESDIRGDGALDYDADTLKTFQCVIASVHSQLAMTEEQATARLVRAIENPYTRILGHPTGRLLLSRRGYTFDVDKVMDACIGNDVAIEINANPHRLDLDWRYLRRGRDKGLKFSIGPDAHSIIGLDDVFFGVGMARKGWLTAADVINCLGLNEFLSWCRRS